MTTTPIDSHAPHGQGDLSRIYAQRFQANLEYRKKVWKILVSEFFSRHIPPGSSILDLGCGYGEFINSIPAKKRFAMDLNPDAPRHLDPSVTFLHQDCSQPWPLETQGLDAVFTSNFFEHLPDKTTLARTLDQIHSALRPGGRLIAMGPNIRCVPGAYWDFWDHYLPLTERSLAEALGNRGFRILQCHARFLPYTMAGKKPAPPILIKAYLKFPIAWRLLGHQFLIIAEKP
jgi:SAM-dependent methyltransferase